ncbi:hypothetical protein RUND412_002306 [Rhizina undulata]
MEFEAKVPEEYPDEYLTETDVDEGPPSGFKVESGFYVPIETGSMTTTIAPTPAPNKSFRLKKDLSVFWIHPRLNDELKAVKDSDKAVLSLFLRVMMWKRRNLSPEDRREFIRIGTIGGLKAIFQSATLLNMQERVRQNHNYIMELLQDQFTAATKQILEDKVTLKEFFIRQEARTKYNMELVRPFISESEITNALLLSDAKIIHNLRLISLNWQLKFSIHGSRKWSYWITPGMSISILRRKPVVFKPVTYQKSNSPRLPTSRFYSFPQMVHPKRSPTTFDTLKYSTFASKSQCKREDIALEMREIVIEKFVYAGQGAPPKSFGRLEIPDSDILQLCDYTLSCIRAQMEGCQQLRVTICRREEDLKKREEILRKHMQSLIMVFDQRASEDAQARKVTAMLDNAIITGPSSLDVWNAFCKQFPTLNKSMVSGPMKIDPTNSTPHQHVMETRGPTSPLDISTTGVNPPLASEFTRPGESSSVFATSETLELFENHKGTLEGSKVGQQALTSESSPGVVELLEGKEESIY